jgi:hypothetical protein
MEKTHTPITGPQNARYEGAWMAKSTIHTATRATSSWWIGITRIVRVVGMPVVSSVSSGTRPLTKKPSNRNTQATAAKTASKTNNAHTVEVTPSAGPRKSPPREYSDLQPYPQSRRRE